MYKYEKRSDPTCQDCGSGSDDVEHTFFRYSVNMDEQDKLRQSIRAPLEPVVEVMLCGPESWDKIAGYSRNVITNKTTKEALIHRMNNHGSSD